VNTPLGEHRSVAPRAICEELSSSISGPLSKKSYRCGAMNEYIVKRESEKTAVDYLRAQMEEKCAFYGNDREHREHVERLFLPINGFIFSVVDEVPFASRSRSVQQQRYVQQLYGSLSWLT
jgi:hypothetical protein